MCLAVPMKILEVRGDGTGIVELDGSRRETSFALVEDPRPGEYVIVHAGFAIEKLDEKEADEQIALFADLARVQNAQARESATP